MHRNVIGYESHDRSVSAVPEIYFYIQKNIITYLFILQMRKYFMQRIEQKKNRELNLFVLWKIGFLARQIGHGSIMRSLLS